LEPTERSAVVRSTVEPAERRLGIESIDVTGTAIHEQEDDVLGPGSEMRLFFGARGWAASFGVSAALVCPAKKAIAGEQVDEDQPGESAADLPKETHGAYGHTAVRFGI